MLRLLLHRGCLDEKHMSDLLMVPRRDALASAFAMLQAGLVDIQEVPKRPDHHPQFTFYLFSTVREGSAGQGRRNGGGRCCRCACTVCVLVCSSAAGRGNN
jgi:hypothetical protein